MTPAARRARWLPVSGLALVLGAMLSFLYVRTQGYDTAAYFENVARLRQLKQVDARWELDVLKARMGLSADYDLLVDPVVQLNRLQQELQAGTGGEHHAEAAALAAGGDALRRAVREKTRLIESFKSHNAVLGNSLAFLSTAADDVQAALEGHDRAMQQRTRAIAARVDDLLLASMIYSRAASEDRAAEIEAELALLNAARVDLPAAIGEPLELFAAHVRTVLREQPVVNRLLADIASVPTPVLADGLDNLLGKEHREAAQRGEQDRLYLLGFAALLVGLIVYAAAGLLRSHAEINRVNQALRGANATLEQRVEERTLELRTTQGELMAAARHAGMAEIANNVLHNVGNVLNSVNVSVGVVCARLSAAQAPKLTQVVELLEQHAADLGRYLSSDERGKLLPQYLGRLAQAFEAERQAVLEELNALVRSVDHIKDIVAAQQAHAGAACVVEAARIAELLDDALRMSADGLARHQVSVVKAVADVPPLMLDRQRLLQIFVNLITNAKQAMSGIVDRPRQLTLGVELAAHADARRLVVRVADQGEGIATENLTRIFSHGFTTRRNGHGFGLHSCVLAAKEMGGTLSAHSDGPGRGAVFTLELPVSIAGATP